MIRLLILIAFVVMPANAQEKEGLLNKLLAPGKLISGHSELEKIDCLKCHGSGNKGIPDVKCLECHKEIKNLVSKKSGYHGRQSHSCFECHSDHKGRDFDSTNLDMDNFDHNSTGYKLTGKHKKMKCSKCHTEKRSKKHLRKGGIRFLGAKTSCKECHKNDDIHFYKGYYKRFDCNKCHSSDSWKKGLKYFNHDKTSFKLRGKHKKMKCAKCHTVNKKRKVSKYEWHGLKSKQCLSCHKDTHKKNLSKKFRTGKCIKCHTQETWKIKKFDHKITGFKLGGAHEQAKCTSCHKQSGRTARGKSAHYKWTGLKSKCLDCHAKKDIHKFYPKRSKKLGNLNDCQKCHTDTKWKDIKFFDHNSKKQTSYLILGKHRKLKCIKCHVPSKFKRAKVTRRKYHWKQLSSKTCNACHKNPHKNHKSKMFKGKKCSSCHTERSWFEKPGFNKGFNHSKTRFKLTGKHKKLNCVKCHKRRSKKIYQFKSFKKEFCVDCHKGPHENQFNSKTNDKACSTCHDTLKFKNIKPFKHDKITNFKLNGKHKKLKCIECHTRSKKFKTESKQKPKVWHKYAFPKLEDKKCSTCHQDYHAGQFKKSCNECHSEKTWKRPKFDHNKDTNFRLRFEHKKAKCYKCHRLSKKYVKFGKYKKKHRVRSYTEATTACVDCHKRDDKHKGSLGNKCNECHYEKNWKYTKDFHKNFTLKSVHYTVDCNECHTGNRKLSGLSDNCVYCHQKDDVHSGSLGDCTECHRQDFWEHTKFRHSSTFFPLKGTHRTLDCFQCHQSNQYQGLPSLCGTCHSSAAVAVPPHTGALANPDCSVCHNEFTFDLGL